MKKLLPIMFVLLLGACTAQSTPQADQPATADQDQMQPVDQPEEPSNQEAMAPTEVTDLSAITLAEVKKHSTKDSCYTAIDGFVYDVTPFISQHPGGEGNIMKICGQDGSAMFGKKHGENQKAQDQLENFKIGVLQS